MKKYIFFFLVFLGLCSCNTDIVYSHFRPIIDNQKSAVYTGWHADSTIRFDYQIMDTTSAYTMIIYVRHTEHYPYQNMWLFVKDSMRCDTIEFYLADDRGQWLGNSHSGFIEMPVLFGTNMHIADTCSRYIDIQHGMRDTLLRGVSDIGVEIIKESK